MSFAPSFSSFPSFDSFPDSGPSQIPKLQTEEKSEKKKKTKGRSSKGKESKREGRSAQSKDTFDASSRAKAEEPTEFYFSDRTGDSGNIQYGKLSSSSIPKYSVVGRGRIILGLSPIITAFSRRSQITLDDRSKSLKLLSVPPQRRLTADSKSTRYQERDGFLLLGQGRRSRTGDPSYRAITQEDNSDSDSDSVVSIYSSSEDERTLSAHEETLRDLEQQLSADPSSITNWLRLLSQTLSTTSVATQEARKARSKITIPLLSRALAAHPANATSPLLRIKYLRAIENVWSESQCDSEWEDALKLGNIDMWMEWLEWRISKSGDGLDGVIDAALRIFSSLDDSEDSEVGKLRVFWRIAIVFKQAGYHERATAMFQAQAEFVFANPEALNSVPLEIRLAAFEEFWDSEVPRMGEPHSKGWSHWVSHKQERNPLTVVTPSVTLTSTELDPYRQWVEYETRADCAGQLPARTTDDNIDSDPYSTILFVDIRPFLLDLRTQRSKNVFRLAWLSTLGLHIPGFSASLSSSGDSWDDRWSYIDLTKPAFLDAILPTADAQNVSLTADALAGALVGRQKVYKQSFGPMKNWSLGSFHLFDPIYGTTGMWNTLDIADVDTAFVSRVFSSLRLGPEDIEWDSLSLAFETALSVKSALKLSRSFLASNRDSLPRWAAHAQLERIRGKLDEACKVYQTVLIASAKPMPRPCEGHLWSDWAEMEWLAGQEEEALSVICRAARVEGQGSLAVLRTRRALNEFGKDCTSWREREAWIKLGALLVILTSHNIQNALSIFDAQLNEIRPRDTAHESLTMACLMFIYRYGSVLKNPVPPSILRERVLQSMAYYPHNSVILALFLEVEKGQGVWGRIRGTLGDNTENVKDVARRVQEVWIAGWESGRWEAEIERTRIGLSGAVEHERTRGCSQIWRIYIEFEIRAKQYKQAKNLFYQAIGQCPRCKELYLLAFGSLRGVFDGRELDALAETMAERGIRMRKGLEEVLEEWEPEKQKNDEAVNNNEDDEIEYNAKELRRLRPY
ncbi:NRDE-2, necessary for RNA interference-domain-containing protein [Lentinula aff. lateritia]|uniref:NRDE-2, necessary for RNA interference-domain-containing protein n=1 Tax=Lentinula aff. lateritia TaxID=2804960 RepID=A0ACC1UG32_9AGAR|nr:NRDE-2, necessary for RNA interference-domain-containing protein [Lentinula aff. lateritia]